MKFIDFIKSMYSGQTDAPFLGYSEIRNYRGVTTAVDIPFDGAWSVEIINTDVRQELYVKTQTGKASIRVHPYRIGNGNRFNNVYVFPGSTDIPRYDIIAVDPNGNTINFDVIFHRVNANPNYKSA